MTPTLTHTGWIIYPRYVARHSDNAFGWLTDEAAACGIDLRVLFAEELTVGYGHGTAPTFWHRGEAVMQLPDFAIVRTYDTVLSRALERAGVPLINSSASMELCKNKMLTHELLAAAGIPTPLTLYAPEGEYDYRHVAGVLGAGRFVVKRIDGAKGEDVFLIDNEEAMRQAVAQCKGHCLCQQFIASSCGRDVRVWVIGDRVAGAVLRYSESSFRSNFSQGGKVAPFDLPDHAAQLAVRSAQLLGVAFSGIDLLFGEDGRFIVNEINGNAGFRTLSQSGRPNTIPANLFAYIRDTYLR